jgi:hypothetical protein
LGQSEYVAALAMIEPATNGVMLGAEGITTRAMSSISCAP